MNRNEYAKFQRYARPQANGCWLWTGDGTRDGYGYIQFPGKPRTMAHILAYEHFIGPVPEGLDLDHKCHTLDLTCPGGEGCQHRRCCNPEHVEPVTRSENTIRQRHFHRLKDACPKGHPYDEANTIKRKNGGRGCRACDIERKRKARQTS